MWFTYFYQRTIFNCLLKRVAVNNYWIIRHRSITSFPSPDELATCPKLPWNRSAKSSVIPRLSLEVLLIPGFSFFDCSSDRIHLSTIQPTTDTVFCPKSIGSPAHFAGQKND